MGNLRIECKAFTELSVDELYEILALRSEVFVVEQNCIFLDLDHKDQKAIHFMGYDQNNQLMAYTRLFDYAAYYEGFLSIGRVVASPRGRGEGYGRQIFGKSVVKVQELFGQKPIKIGAQAYLESFYASFGFESINEDYIEDGIPHKIMVRA
ncbi:GNAT family N-acetyltransferase [Lacihabitans soyangensis]|uniref:GNAT family N-acetyltransferase n=1 Tax=Lacihabitans soyangensis TaxID=869394 RepID=A0AAE3GZ31_9BACT|nr:GNAT family N-acetyltransferase [Lacihabitans soyangensis]MCP9761697.1 GNAT family N-acetyltransferase [Lacihabitans soyangensis]